MGNYRQVAMSFGPPLTRMVKILLIITGGAFLLTYLPAQLFGWNYPYAWFGLQPRAVTYGLQVWRLVTYLFLHGGFFHVIFNLFALWMFGADLERLWGGKRFLFYYFLTGIGAGLLDVLLQPSALTMAVGCSGAIYGLLLAFGLVFPDRPIFLWLIIPVKAKWFVLIMGLIEFVGSWSNPGSGISHVAHLGGMLFGLAYLRGGGLTLRLVLPYQAWRRARLRRKFEVYMRKHESKDGDGRWVN
jgi:membrane associated rhomboid family serine protease